MFIGVRSRTVHSHGVVYDTVRILKDILEEEFYVTNDFISKIEIAEKSNSKFCKPTSPLENTLYLFVGGWRLVNQDRGKAELSNPSFCGVNTGRNLVTLYAPAANALYKVTTPEGHIIAEVIERHMVNILFDICGLSLEQQKVMLRYIFKDILENFYSLNVEQLKSEMENRRKSEVVDFLTMLSSREIERVESDLRCVESSIRNFEAEIGKLIEKRRKYMTEVEVFRMQLAQGTSVLQAEIDSVEKLDRVESISVDARSRCFVIHTKDIYITNAGKRHYIGKFIIKINPISGEINFNNINNRRRSYWGPSCHHPHVDQQGRACWGNVSSAIRTYISQNEYQAVASLLIGFLESVNTTDPAGKNITSWDVVNNAGLVIQTGYDYRNPPEDVALYTCYGCQDLFSRDNLAFTRGNVHLCRHCADNYFTCSECGDLHLVEDGEKCPECGETLICEDCIDEVEQCRHCAEKARKAKILQELQENQTICSFCDTVINDDEVYTCETCGAEGCSNCVTFDGRYSCPNHR